MLPFAQAVLEMGVQSSPQMPDPTRPCLPASSTGATSEGRRLAGLTLGRSCEEVISFDKMKKLRQEALAEATEHKAREHVPL